MLADFILKAVCPSFFAIYLRGGNKLQAAGPRSHKTGRQLLGQRFLVYHFFVGFSNLHIFKPANL